MSVQPRYQARQSSEVPVFDEILTKLRALAVQRFGPKAGDLGADEDLFEGLGIDSLQAMDLLTDLEEAFDVEIPDYELQGVNTLDGLASLISERV